MYTFDLRHFREDYKISQKALSEQLGVGQSFISQIENGKDPMPNALISKLKEIYQLDDVSKYYKGGIGHTTTGNFNTISGNITVADYKWELEIARLQISHLEQRLKDFEQRVKDKDEMIELLKSAKNSA